MGFREKEFRTAPIYLSIYLSVHRSVADVKRSIQLICVYLDEQVAFSSTMEADSCHLQESSADKTTGLFSGWFRVLGLGRIRIWSRLFF